MNIAPGKKLRVFGQLHHVVAIAYDGDETIVLMKRWLRHKQYWHYEAMPLWQVEYILGIRSREQCVTK